jgi:uncharacterized membrane protein
VTGFTPQIRRTFLILGALLGACYGVILPPLQAPDEFAHLDRAYGIAEGTCVARALTPIPVSIKELIASFPPKLETQFPINSEDIWQFVRMPLDEKQQAQVKNEAANMYSCFPYLPEAIGIEAGRMVGASPGVILYLSRLANLIAYLAVVYLALGLLPDFQIPLLALALMPMVLHQAASASWDGVAYATGFLLCAYILKLAWDPNISTLGLRHYLGLGAIVVFAALCKTDVWLAPLLILVPAERFKGSRRKLAVLAGVAVLAVAVISGWNFVNREQMLRWIGRIKEWRQIDFSANAAFIYQHPVMFLQAARRTWGDRWPEYAAEFVGKLGWLAVRLLQWAVWLYWALLGAVSLTGTAAARLKPVHRLVCLGVVAVAVASIFIGMWCAEVPVDYREGVLHGVGHVPGVQGRYFIPFALPVLLVFSNTLLRVNWKWLLAAVAVVVVTVNAIALVKIEQTFYLTVAPATYYENKLVRQVDLSGDDAKVYWIHAGKKQWVQHASWITSHGYRWPDDVGVISGAQLATIPEGEVISEP